LEKTVASFPLETSPIYHDTDYQPPRAKLSVSDVERIAKAGVAVPWESIRDQVCRDEDFRPVMSTPDPRTPEDTFWDRYNASHQVRNPFTFYERHFKITCHAHADKVSVFVRPFKHDSEVRNVAHPTMGDTPFIIEDEACLYPSDALMAKIALWERSRGKT
jgi:hypothetical protein